MNNIHEQAGEPSVALLQKYYDWRTRARATGGYRTLEECREWIEKNVPQDQQGDFYGK